MKDTCNIKVNGQSKAVKKGDRAVVREYQIIQQYICSGSPLAMDIW